MNYELIKNEFIKLKKDELNYIDRIAKISNIKILNEFEKIEIYRTLKKYIDELNKLLSKIGEYLYKNITLTEKKCDDIIIEFNIEKDYLSSINSEYKEYLLEELGIDSETSKFKLPLFSLIRKQKYQGIDFYLIQKTIQNNQKLIETPIYIFKGYYDRTKDCCGMCAGSYDDFLYGIYEDLSSFSYNSNCEEVLKKNMKDFEKDKIIIYSKPYVDNIFEIKRIFYEELLNIENNSINDCVVKTKKKIDELSYIRSPEYKEKVLLSKIDELYRKNNNSSYEINKKFELENDKKNFIVVIGITQEKEYIITFQNKIKNQIIAEFPSTYINNSEDPIESVNRFLEKKAGFVTNDSFIIDETIIAPGIDNSTAYIIVANNCTKIDEKKSVNYGLFSEKEIEYLINNNIINGTINKLAYYNLINNLENCNFYVSNNNKKIYKQKRKKQVNLNN